MKTGFTLIELLVVVLIIGILAAIALPQYQKAVERSRTAEAIQYLGDWANAQSIYYMQNNEFTEDIDDGDISLPTPGDAFTYEPTVSGVIAELVATRTSGIYEGCSLQIFVAGNGQIEKLCYAEEGKEAFCTIAQTAGYVVAEEEEEGSCPNGVWVPGHMIGDRFIEGKCVVLNPISPMG